VARKKQQAVEITSVPDKSAPFTPSKILTSTKEAAPRIPTYDPRHTTAIRLGKVSSEIFCRDPERRRQLGLNQFPTMESDFISELRK
jgi:hypothetical protein